MSEKEVIIPKSLRDVRPLVKARKFSSLDKSKQTFDGIRLVEAVNGNLVLRGRNGMRDMIYPLDKAWPMFFRMCEFYKKLYTLGTNVADEMRDVLYNFGRSMQQAIDQRKKFEEKLPGFINNVTKQELAKQLDMLRTRLKITKV